MPTQCGFTLQRCGLNLSVDDERYAKYVGGAKNGHITHDHGGLDGA